MAGAPGGWAATPRCVWGQLGRQPEAFRERSRRPKRIQSQGQPSAFPKEKGAVPPSFRPLIQPRRCSSNLSPQFHHEQPSSLLPASVASLSGLVKVLGEMKQRKPLAGRQVTCNAVRTRVVPPPLSEPDSKSTQIFAEWEGIPQLTELFKNILLAQELAMPASQPGGWVKVGTEQNTHEGPITNCKVD